MSMIPVPAVLNSGSSQATNLFAWYPFVNATTGPFNQPDLSGNGRNLSPSYSSPTLISAPEITTGHVASFNSGAVIVSASSPVSTPEMSFAIWFRQTTISDYDAGPLNLDSIHGSGFNLEFRTGSGYPGIWRHGIGGGGLNSPTAIANNTWYHVVCTFKAYEWIIYLNGVEVANRTDLPNAMPNLGDIRVGQANNLFIGATADIRIYNKVLTSSEVAAMYNSSTRWDLYYVAGVGGNIILNSLFVGTGNNAGYLLGEQAAAQNCGAVGAGFAGDGTFDNCFAVSKTSFVGFADGTCTDCASSDGTADALTGINPEQFVDYNSDWRLLPNSVLWGAGGTLDFTVDGLGTTRIGTWSIGPYQTSGFIPVRALATGLSNATEPVWLTTTYDNEVVWGDAAQGVFSQLEAFNSVESDVEFETTITGGLILLDSVVSDFELGGIADGIASVEATSYVAFSGAVAHSLTMSFNVDSGLGLLADPGTEGIFPNDANSNLIAAVTAAAEAVTTAANTVNFQGGAIGTVGSYIHETVDVGLLFDNPVTATIVHNLLASSDVSFEQRALRTYIQLAASGFNMNSTSAANVTTAIVTALELDSSAAATFRAFMDAATGFTVANTAGAVVTHNLAVSKTVRLKHKVTVRVYRIRRGHIRTALMSTTTGA